MSSKHIALGEGARKDDSVWVKIFMRHGFFGDQSNVGHINMQHCVRTSARIRKDTDEKHDDQNPKIPRQTNVHATMHCFASSMCLRRVTSDGVFCCCVSMFSVAHGYR